MTFRNLGLSTSLLQTLASKEISEPFKIQEKIIPDIIQGKDLMGIAKTGSGKTLSYVLPLLHNIERSKPTGIRHIDALILVPTRELAMQVNTVIRDFLPALKLNVSSYAVFGGVAINPQMRALNNVNILVATPGRLLELFKANAVKLSSVNTLVIDEADRMLQMDFRKELDQIIQELPPKRQNLLFSATLNKKVDDIKTIVLNRPVIVEVVDKEIEVEQIKQTAYDVSDERKGPFLRYLIKSKDMKQVLIFTSSAQKANNVAQKLEQNGIEARAIHSKKSVQARTKALELFKRGELNVLVSTDLLSRGIDIDFLPYVINYELPRSPKDFIHRIGRTGRAEATGEAISLVTPEEEPHFWVIQKKNNFRLKLVKTKDIDLQGF